MLAGLALFASGCSGSGEGNSTATSLAVTTAPANGAQNVVLNRKVTASFSQAMDPTTLTNVSFTLAGPDRAKIPGAVSYLAGSKIATFAPNGNLNVATRYTATITTMVLDATGRGFPDDIVWTFTTGTSVDVTAPQIVSTSPTAGEGEVPVNRRIAAVFDEAMDPATLGTATFAVTGPGGVAVTGVVTYAALGNTATFAPSSDLTAGAVYAATISTGVKDIAGNGLAVARAWTFTTGVAKDETAPTLRVTAPIPAAIDVAVNSSVTAFFSETMDPATVTATTFTVASAAGLALEGTVTCLGATATFDPTSDLAPNTALVAKISTGAKDLAGNALASDYVWTFTTAATADVTAPTLSSTIPRDAAIDVSRNRDIVATFSEAMDPLTITAATFKVTGPDFLAISGVVINFGSSSTFQPSADLAANTLYTVSIAKEAKDIAGNALGAAAIWSFKTGADTAAGPAPVVLGTSGDFVLLAKTAISTTGVTTIVGDVGLSPSAQTFLTGFSEALDASTTFATAGIVTGKLYAADMTPPTPAKMTTAISDMETAYTDAAGRTLPDFTELGAGDISGMTLVPGLYKWGTGLLMTSDVTLAGGANDVWIFQIAENLTVSNGVIVGLSGALPKNVFWQVAGQVVLGTTADFKGIVLSQTKIVLQTGAIFSGRALAQTAVTLDANAVTEPAR